MKHFTKPQFGFHPNFRQSRQSSLWVHCHCGATCPKSVLSQREKINPSDSDLVFNYNQTVVSNDLAWVHDCRSSKINFCGKVTLRISFGEPPPTPCLWTPEHFCIFDDLCCGWWVNEITWPEINPWWKNGPLRESCLLGHFVWKSPGKMITSDHWIMELGYFFRKKCNALDLPPSHAGCNRHHQDCRTCFGSGNLYKSLFATGILGWRVDPSSTNLLVWNQITSNMENEQFQCQKSS